MAHRSTVLDEVTAETEKSPIGTKRSQTE